ncbi:cytochrome o ubiquinol oxidase subunit IV [Cupriavidus necator]|jgi:cytochrome o ubiquinol oxidase operon protein cyoD|uniref:Cytochrome bo(3) ubiquinol oxidase subunit 4 n=1 Tax=Cupriavidus pinatubonensis (strain JMP 134 / LMG 1197) TaxID=264198 RepID=Q46SF8_CUPPJ|nr:cytochrome o ubiquinol oxidase subunit IV [Cupriavidus necator]
MTTSHASHATHAAHDAAAHDGSHGSPRSYAIGFALSLVLTFASFGAVMSGALPPGMGLPVIVGLCVAQLLVQLSFFLHLGIGKGQRGNSGIFACTFGLIVIVIAGSLWVMHNADTNMMPTQMTIERARAKD